MMVLAGQFTSSVMNTLTLDFQVGLPTCNTESIRTELGLSVTLVGLPTRFSMASAPLISVTTQSITRFLLLRYSHFIQHLWVKVAADVAAASRVEELTVYPSEDSDAIPTSASPCNSAKKYSSARTERSTATWRAMASETRSSVVAALAWSEISIPSASVGMVRLTDATVMLSIEIGAAN